MGYFSKIAWASFTVTGGFLSSGAAIAAGLSCVNPALNVELFQSPEDDKVFESDWIQFNVNHPAAAGTLFVDNGNHAICEISTPTLPLSGEWEFDPQATRNAGAVRIRFDRVPPARRRFVIMQGSADQTVVVARFKVRVQ